MTEPTPPLDEFRAAYEQDDNQWWRLGGGDHQNLFDAACERLDAVEAALGEVQWLCDEAEAQPSWKQALTPAEVRRAATLPTGRDEPRPDPEHDPGIRPDHRPGSFLGKRDRRPSGHIANTAGNCRICGTPWPCPAVPGRAVLAMYERHLARAAAGEDCPASCPIHPLGPHAVHGSAEADESQSQPDARRTDTASDEGLERAAKAAFHAFGHDVAPSGSVAWEQVPEEMRVTFRMVADAVLAASDEGLPATMLRNPGFDTNDDDMARATDSGRSGLQNEAASDEGLRAEVERLRAGLWNVYAALGYDTSDGIPTWPDLPTLVYNAAVEHRRDAEDGYEEALRECGALQRQVNAERERADAAESNNAEARKEGYADGFTDGRREAKREARDQRDALQRQVDAVKALPQWLTDNGMDPQSVAFVKRNLDTALSAEADRDGERHG